MERNLTAAVFGATGLIGGGLLRALCDRPEYARVRAFVRRPTGFKHPKLEETVVDFAKLADHARAIAADHVYCCLGTTRRQAGSKEAFRKVDGDLPVEIARLAANGGTSRFLMVSSIGADPQSKFLYLRVKGETERTIGSLGFLEAHFFRPSFLVGPRTGERASEERKMRALLRARSLFVGPLAKYRAIPSDKVAHAMIDAALAPASGGPPRVIVHDSLELLARA